jgi:phage tail-like protein
VDISKVSVPEIYKSSDDFRFFLKWFENSLSRIQYDTENLSDLYDPLRCPEELVWMLADTIGFKYDDRLPTAYNRLILLYFMSMIRNRGSKDGVTLAAETNLAQFNILEYGKENEILYNRLEDTNIPVNSAYVTPHTPEGYIEVVYFSDRIPIDSCIEYVRPLGMYMFQYAGVRCDSRTKISIDARLTNLNDLDVSIGPTHVGHYSRNDYARMQHMYNEEDHDINTTDTRRNVWYRNSVSEGAPDPFINPGYRTLYSLQLCNNEHIVRAILPKQIFGLGYGPTINTEMEIQLKDEMNEPYAWNLRYDKTTDKTIIEPIMGQGVETLDPNREMESTYTNPVPKVNDIKLKPEDENVGE